MHDVIISQSILKELKQYNNVKEVTIEVGELYGIEPDHLLEHLKEVCEIKFTAVSKESLVKCKQCGYQGRAHIIERLHDLVLYDCPKCESEVEVIKGDKLIIKRVKEES